MAKKEHMTKKTDAELSKLIAETRAQIRAERFTAAGSRPKDPNALSNLRQVVARALTERRARELSGTSESVAVA